MKHTFLFIMLLLSFRITVAQTRKLSVGQGGWLTERSATSSNTRKFIFGIWGIPRYNAIHNKSKFTNSDLAKSKASFAIYGKEFDLIFTHSEYIKDYMSDQIIMTGSSEFSYMFKDYLKRTDNGYVDGKPLNMEKLAKAYGSGMLNTTMSNGFDYLRGQFNKKKDWTYIWAPIDEVVSWPPSLIKALYQTAKKQGSNLVYCDLLGSGKANSYTTRYQKINVRKSTNETSYINSWTENIKKVAREYSNCGDIYGVNAYGEFYADPILAGKAVDGIKAALGSNVPVWLWFDPVGYAKPRNVGLQQYIQNVKCQIYTSIVHGATGVLLYNDLRKSPSDFDAFYPVLKELKQNSTLFYFPNVEYGSNGHLHFCIKKDPTSGEKFAIVTNTSKTQNLSFLYAKNSKILKPLEVYISKVR